MAHQRVGEVNTTKQLMMPPGLQCSIWW